MTIQDLEGAQSLQFYVLEWDVNCQDSIQYSLM